MPISYVGQNSGAGSSIAVPAHVAGDFLIGFAFRDGNTTAPSLPGDWNNGHTAGANSCSVRAGWKRATSNAEVSGTWTNASAMAILVYSGLHPVFPIDPAYANDAGASGVSVLFDTIADPLQEDGSSWFIGMIGHRSTNTILQFPPNDMVNRASFVDATCEIAVHDTDGGLTAWPISNNIGVGGTTAGWISIVFELRAAQRLVLCS